MIISAASANRPSSSDACDAVVLWGHRSILGKRHVHARPGGASPAPLQAGSGLATLRAAAAARL